MSHTDVRTSPMSRLIQSKRLFEDLSPDYYYFDFMGKKGMFFLGDDGYWKVCSEDNLDVIFDYDNPSNFCEPFIDTYPENNKKKQPSSIKGFTLIDDNGIKYIFGVTDLVSESDPVEYTIPFEGIGGAEKELYWVSQRWYLSAIQDRSGNVLYKFHYQRGPFVSSFKLHCYNETITYYHDKNARSRTNGNVQNLVVDESINKSRMVPYKITLSSPVYLDSVETLNGGKIYFDFIKAFSTNKSVYKTAYNEITTDATYDFTGNVEFKPFPFKDCLASCINHKGGNPFSYLQDTKYKKYWYRQDIDNEDPLSATGLLCLNYITIKCGSLNKKYILKYNQDRRFIHLEGIDINDGNDTQSYKFSYNNWNKIPYDYSTYYTDHYGFFIGDKNWGGIGISPNTYYRAGFGNTKTEQYYDYYASQRKPNQCAKYGLLSKIVYPTGGCQIFKYQLNEADQILSEDRKSMKYTLDWVFQRRREQELNEEQQTDYGIFCGGCRIFSITTYDDTLCQKLIGFRKFVYEDGQVYSFPSYKWKGELYTLEKCKKAEYKIFSCHPVSKLYDLQGFNVGYSKVTELNDNGTKTVYEYTNISSNPAGFDNGNECMDTAYNFTNSPFEVFGDKSFGRGRLLSYSVFDEYGKPLYKQKKYISQ